MDNRALQILFDTYWSDNGWKPLADQKASEADFAYAKGEGVMFDPITITHDECLSRLHAAAKQTTQQKVSAAFLSSLSTHSLHMRSALSSYHFASTPQHRYTTREMQSPYVYPYCDTCSSYILESRASYSNEDLSILNFERYKFGGVRNWQLLYCMFDMEQFILEEVTEPTIDDIQIFKSILDAIEGCDDDDAPRQLEKRLSGLFKANKNERSQLIELLGWVGILHAAHERPIRGIRNNWRSAEHWRGEDGYDHTAVDALFGMYL